ncbi:CocE/NonD family hydrolase [Niveispirillum sp. KHB5.9]|uniref:CocE/NonD family hydrolase n=1 Tax=Niveispirillum sp. KHB5.9 TaxID=3400269 RepID=UPI003A83C3B4
MTILPGAPYDVAVDEDVEMRTRDGVRLVADIYHPVANCTRLPGPWPVLLERTPYDRRGVNLSEYSLANPNPRSRVEIAQRFASSGYVVMMQDCRGRYASEGTFEKYVNEAEDGYDTLAWITAQPWCDGRVGTFGLSYGAHVQMAMACLNPPGLACMVVDSGGFSDAYHAGIRQGGAFELKQLTWAYKQALLSPAVMADPAHVQALLDEDLFDWFRRLPWSEGHSPLRSVPEYESYVLKQWRQGEYGDFWRQVGLSARNYYAACADVPTVHLCGWYDPYVTTIISNLTGLSAAKQGPTHMVMGPWTHGQRSRTYAGDVDFGPAATLDGNLADDYDRFRLSWFDRWLKDGKADPADAPVRLFVMGGGSGQRNADGRLDHGGRWLSAQNWPLPGTDFRTFHLHADGGLRAETSTGQSLSWRHDPTHPVPTIGGAHTSGQPVMEPGAYDQVERADFFGCEMPGRPLAERDDVLVFQTPPLESDTTIAGPIDLVLHVSSDRPDTDIALKLIDVYPDGFAMNLSHGIRRLRYRDGWEKPSFMEPGKVYEVRMEMFPIANLFKAGHRIRLDVSSSNFPHFDVNLNTGGAQGMPDTPVVAANRLHLDTDHPSRITLPVQPLP